MPSTNSNSVWNIRELLRCERRTLRQRKLLGTPISTMPNDIRRRCDRAVQHFNTLSRELRLPAYDVCLYKSTLIDEGRVNQRSTTPVSTTDPPVISPTASTKCIANPNGTVQIGPTSLEFPVVPLAAEEDDDLIDRAFLDEQYRYRRPSMADYTKLPSLEHLNKVMSECLACLRYVDSLVARRETLYERILSTCLCVEGTAAIDTSPSRSFSVSRHRASIVLNDSVDKRTLAALEEVVEEEFKFDLCNHGRHEEACRLMRELDALTADILRGILEWRGHLSRPLPYMYTPPGSDVPENYLFRLFHQHAAQGVISTLGRHLHATCRHLSFFYLSPFEALNLSVNPHSIRCRRATHTPEGLWYDIVVREADRQELSIATALDHTRRGLWSLMLRWYPKGTRSKTVCDPRQTTPASPLPPLVLLTEKKVKEKVLLRHTVAALSLQRARPRSFSAPDALVSVIYTMTNRTFRMHCLRLWREWCYRQRIRRSIVKQLAQFTSRYVLKERFDVWKRKLLITKYNHTELAPLIQAFRLALLQRYMRNWLHVHRWQSCRRTYMRTFYLQYFRFLHFLALYRRFGSLQKHFEARMTLQSVLGHAGPTAQSLNTSRTIPRVITFSRTSVGRPRKTNFCLPGEQDTSTIAPRRYVMTNKVLALCSHMSAKMPSLGKVWLAHVLSVPVEQMMFDQLQEREQIRLQEEAERLTHLIHTFIHEFEYKRIVEHMYDDFVRYLHVSAASPGTVSAATASPAYSPLSSYMHSSSRLV